MPQLNHTFTYYYQGLIVPLSILVPIGVALVNFSSINKPVKHLLLYLVVSGSINLLAILQSSSNNLPLLHIYTIMEFLLLMLYFISINNNSKILLFSKCLLFLFPLLCVINVLFFQSKYKFNSYVRPLEALIFISYSLYYFVHSTNVENNQKWGSAGLNWINSGLLLYFSSSFFLFIFSNVISVSLTHDVKMVIWNIHDSFVLILYLLLAFGFSKCRPSQKTSVS